MGNVIKINEKEQYNAASCIKIFILVELFNQINNGTKSRNDEIPSLYEHYVNGSGILGYLSKNIKLPILDVAILMIISDNVATNMLIDYLWIENINKIIKDIGCKYTELYSMFKPTEDEIFSFAPVVNYIAIKSEKYQTVRNDGRIVSTKYGNYILTILIKDFKDEKYLNDEYVYNQGRQISNIIFNEFIRKSSK